MTQVYCFRHFSLSLSSLRWQNEDGETPSEGDSNTACGLPSAHLSNNDG